MLNDVLSLCVGLWAVRVSDTGNSKIYTYGWQRAETLGALINGVFLVALCLSIFLEAIQRFVKPQVVTNPKLVFTVGCLGLASNMLGLFLSHEHGHSHGGDEHTHRYNAIKSAEEGHIHVSTDSNTRLIADEGGDVEKISPQIRIAGYEDEENTTLPGRSSNSADPESVANGKIYRRHRRRGSTSSVRGFGSVENIRVHPASLRHDVIQAAGVVQRSESEATKEDALLGNLDSPSDRSKVFADSHGSPSKGDKRFSGHGSIGKHASRDYNHAARNPQTKGDSHTGHGHSHGDLNMRGVFLHVMGDALGNIGVITSALIIWFTTFPGRYYCDPAISLAITVIILYSAIPLCKAASRILLQAVPVGLSIEEITADIEALPRVIEAHHLHVWQLSDTKLVASLHVKVDCEVEGAESQSYMHLARKIRSCLRDYGIHSSTIQPEFTTADPQSPTINQLASQRKRGP